MHKIVQEDHLTDGFYCRVAHLREKLFVVFVLFGKLDDWDTLTKRLDQDIFGRFISVYQLKKANKLVGEMSIACPVFYCTERNANLPLETPHAPNLQNFH